MPSQEGVITILLLRHGERADEIESFEDSFSSAPLSTKESLDPPLTDEGHQQAIEAFEQIIPFLMGKKAAIFVSPLRRTIATAAMIGMCQSTEVEFMEIGENNETVESTLPLIVLNGLSDCAAHVEMVGGAFAAVRKGYIDGAAMAANHIDDHSSPSTPLQKLLANIPILGNLLRPIQFYKEHDGGFSPMSHPIGCSESATMMNGLPPNPTSTLETSDRELPVNTTPVARRASDDCFMATINRLVRIAASRGCHICVVVTHREGIRDMARSAMLHENSRGRHPRLSTPYCCIGHFSAEIQANADGAIEWKLHGVVPYEEFGN
jgi:hypothetical protein